MISVIMPVYNSEKYLSGAIESVLNQTYKDFELILIDDGSKDNSGVICDTYAMKDKRIKVVHQKNGGICFARNVGLSIASGEYISFIDNDDLFDKYLLEDNYKLAKSYNADIVSFGVATFENENYMTTFKNDSKMINYYDTNSIRDNYFKIRTNHLVNIWNKLFKREIIIKNNICFHESFKYGYEDYIFNIENVFVANNLVTNSKRYYNHFARLGYSTSLKYNFNRIESLLEGYKIEMDNCIKFTDNYNQIGANAFYIKIVARELFGKDKDLSFKEKKEIIKKFQMDLKDMKSFSTVKCLYQIDKIVAIEWFLYVRKWFVLLYIMVKMLKTRAKILKQYF